MKYILKNPTEDQIKSLKKLGLCVFYSESEGIHYVDVPEITEEELPKVDVVDLGLPSGLKWASCNIGASKPCEYGKLFQFGRVDGYAYGDNNHNFYVGEDIPTTTSGKTYAKGAVLGPDDDAANVATNGKLRMPTVDEIDELLANTTNQWCQCTVLGADHTSHNVYGRLFTGSNSNKIFIPATGYFGTNGEFDAIGRYGYVWSSSVYSDDAEDEVLCAYAAYYLYLGSDECPDPIGRGFDLRSAGFPVRGICK